MTRMWMVNPKMLCRQHLLGEHKEIHQLIGSINKGISIAGYIEKKIVQVKSIKQRHNDLVAEMLNRGYNHNSPLPKFSISKLPLKTKQCRVDKNQSFKELLARCNNCRMR